MGGQASSRSDDPEAALRETAIDLFISGCRPVSICHQLKRSRTWFYNTLARYRSGGREGLKSKSRAPKRVHNRTPEDVEAAIVRLRKAITCGEDPELRYANIGADALAFELARAEITPPHRATINRILKRHGLVQPRRRKSKKHNLPDDYPWPCVRAPNELHLLDFVTRSIRGAGRFYSCNLLDQFRRWPFLRAETPKSAAVVSQFLVQGWQEIGLPGSMYLDNDAVWNGGGRGQRVLSTIVRLCLFVGVEVIFIPAYTYEANPIIESFNGVWDSNFWGRMSFRDLPHVQSEMSFFEHYCRHRRPLAEFGGLTADQVAPDFVPRLLPSDFDQHRRERLPITAGKVHFIRFVSSTDAFSILNEL
jgi:transposase InsO family protein